MLIGVLGGGVVQCQAVMVAEPDPVFCDPRVHNTDILSDGWESQ